MSSPNMTLSRAAALTLVVLAACHGNKEDGDPDSSKALPLAPYGLDARPVNGTCKAPPNLPAGDGKVALKRVFAGLTFNGPMMLKQAPGDASRWYLIERAGLVSTFPARDDVLPGDRTTVIDLTSKVNDDGEGGMLGLALHPQFTSNGKFYLSYTSTGPGNGSPLTSHLSQFTAVNNVAQVGGELPLLSLDQPYTNHKGGNVQFGRDGMLYLGLGDGGDANDPGQRAQNLNLWFGKMLRIDVNTPANGNNYSIPRDNPYAQGGGLKEIYASGLRNPWRWSVDRETGQLWVGDVGQDRYEEIDILTRGGNYGWRIREGLHCNTTVATPADCNATGFIDPIFEYPHSDGQSITGGYVYRGTALPALYGAYIYGDYVTGHIWALSRDATTGAYSTTLLVDASQLISFSEGEDGELYVLTGNQIQRLVPANPGPAVNFPQRLSATGCFDAKQPGAALIPYTVNSPLWSDGASKNRWVMVPDGATAHVEADGHITLPVGSVLFKEFAVDGKRVETRMLVRHEADLWGAYTYAWDAGETEATLQGASATRALGSGKSWTTPSRGQCNQCHTEVAEHSLGMQVEQLNGVADYVSTQRRANQLATWQHIGLFDSSQDANALRALANPTNAAASTEARARAYLHANCANCHQPGGTGQGPADFRFSTPLAAMNICDRPPQEGSLGVNGAVLLKPGTPAQSIISLRVHALDDARMPPLASAVVDAEGVAVVDAWITSLTACP